MANFTAADIKSLRDRTGAGMIDVKNALTEAEGDFERAVELLRLKGAKANAKREDRTTSEGLVAVNESAEAVTLIELACETDFVAKGDKFIALAQRSVDAAAAANAGTVEEALAAPLEGKTVGDVIAEESAVLGEKVLLTRINRLTGSNFAVYLHRTSKDLPPQVGVVVAFDGDDADTARAVAQHIAMFDPQFISRDEVAADAVERERELVTEIAKNEGKPEAALPKIIEGRLAGFYKQIVLVDQDYARDNKQSVGKVLSDAGLTVTSFARFKVGA
ncbi:translation elongation factor Ts [Humidisolicoccus flavus]|uniref:translation elongation factor Ts n=1 Tax=Humidisolicoccus flavus TaxID=3111414 RepID=UPI003254F63E